MRRVVGRLRGDVDVGGGEAGRFGDRLAGVAQAFEVEGDRVVHLAFDVRARARGGDAAGQIGRVGEKPASGLPSITIR